MYRTVDGETVHCVAISGEGRPRVHIFYAKGVAERRVWAQKILEATTPVFPTRYTAELTKAGWAYLKVSKKRIFIVITFRNANIMNVSMKNKQFSIILTVC